MKKKNKPKTTQELLLKQRKTWKVNPVQKVHKKKPRPEYKEDEGE